MNSQTEEWPYRIPLSRGFIALVDAEDVLAVLRYANWTYGGSKAHPYAFAHVPGSSDKKQGIQGKNIYLHHFIAKRMGLEYIEIDHHNRDGLDNRRLNLRPATRAGNLSNIVRNNQTDFRGVYINGPGYAAKVGGHYLGQFKTAFEAHLAYEVAARKKYGAFYPEEQ